MQIPAIFYFLSFIEKGNLHQDCTFIPPNLLESVNFGMIEMTKEKNLAQRLLKSCERADKTQNAILFSYSFRFEIRDLLPILAHPIDKNTIRVYWEQPSQGISFAGLGSILEFQQSVDKNPQNNEDDANQPSYLGWHGGGTYPSIGNLRPSDLLGMQQVYEMISGNPHLGLGASERIDEITFGDLESESYLLHTTDPYSIHNDGGGMDIFINRSS